MNDEKVEVAISAHGLTKTYRQGRQIEVRALDNVDIEFYKGEFASVIGPSGSGKSTLLNLLGLLDTPTSGEVNIDGKTVSNLSKSQKTDIRREKIGFVFQQYNLIPSLTALENVMLPLRYVKGSRRQARQKALEALEAVGLKNRFRHRPFELSGGEQQRVTIARSLINNPSLILADEPTGELDTKTSFQVLEMMQELNRRRHQTFVIVTHNLEIAAKTDRIIKMRDGKIKSISNHLEIKFGSD